MTCRKRRASRSVSDWSNVTVLFSLAFRVSVCPSCPDAQTDRNGQRTFHIDRCFLCLSVWYCKSFLTNRWRLFYLKLNFWPCLCKMLITWLIRCHSLYLKQTRKWLWAIIRATSWRRARTAKRRRWCLGSRTFASFSKTSRHLQLIAAKTWP